MAKTNSLGVRLQPGVKAALERAAKEDMRSLSSLIEKILVEWLRQRGYLPPPSPESAKG
jgi:hypothetical protein